VKATEKIDSFGVKALADRVGVDVVTIWRWKRAIDGGKGVSDDNKRRLVEATAEAAHPIAYADFFPASAESPLRAAQ
jgi:hypothetical protein